MCSESGFCLPFSHVAEARRRAPSWSGNSGSHGGSRGGRRPHLCPGCSHLHFPRANSVNSHRVFKVGTLSICVTRRMDSKVNRQPKIAQIWDLNTRRFQSQLLEMEPLFFLIYHFSLFHRVKLLTPDLLAWHSGQSNSQFLFRLYALHLSPPSNSALYLLSWRVLWSAWNAGTCLPGPGRTFR